MSFWGLQCVTVNNDLIHIQEGTGKLKGATIYWGSFSQVYSLFGEYTFCNGLVGIKIRVAFQSKYGESDFNPFKSRVQKQVKFQIFQAVAGVRTKGEMFLLRGGD